MRIFTAEVVRIVGQDEGDVQFLLETKQIRLDLALLFKALVLDLEVEVAATEDVLILRCRSFGLLVAPCQQFLA